MSNKNETVIYKWFEEVWNKNSEASIDKLMAADADIHGIESPNGKNGAEGFTSFFKAFNEQFKDVRIEVEHVIKEEDMETALTHVTAFEKASGKKIQFSGLCMTRIKDGKIAEAWNHYDFMNMYHQLGHKMVPA